MPRAPAIKYQGILYPHGVEARVKKFLKRISSIADKKLVIFQDSATRLITLSLVCLDILDYLNLSLMQASKQ